MAEADCDLSPLRKADDVETEYSVDHFHRALFFLLHRLPGVRATTLPALLPRRPSGLFGRALRPTKSAGAQSDYEPAKLQRLYKRTDPLRRIRPDPPLRPPLVPRRRDRPGSLSLSPPSSISPPPPPTFQAKWTAAGSLATLLSIAATSLAMIAWKKLRRRRRRRESGSEEFRHLVQEAARRSKKIVTYFSALLLLFSADV